MELDHVGRDQTGSSQSGRVDQAAIYFYTNVQCLVLFPGGGGVGRGEVATKMGHIFCKKYQNIGYSFLLEIPKHYSTFWYGGL